MLTKRAVYFFSFAACFAYPPNINGPRPFAAEDEATVLISAGGQRNTSFQSTGDAFEISPPTLSWPPTEYHSKTSFTQSILFARFNRLTGIPTNARPEYSRFPGLSASQTTFGTDTWLVDADEWPQYYPAANLVSADSRPVWDVNGQSSSSADPINLWTPPLVNGDPDPNHAPLPGFQFTNVCNVNSFAFGPAADYPITSEPSPAPYSGHYGADSNLDAIRTRFEAPNGSMLDPSPGYNPKPIITSESLSQNTLNVMVPEALPENNDSFPQTQATSPWNIMEPEALPENSDYFPQTQAPSADETINSEMSPSNQDEHERVGSAGTCMECFQTFRADTYLNFHATSESHTAFMCKCGKGYTRLDVLSRHLDSYRPELPKFKCPHCKSNSGGKSFKRKDHLTQHIRGFHSIDTQIQQVVREYYLCPHSDCLLYREPDFFDLPDQTQKETRPFVGVKDFKQHMRTVHDESSYPCDVSGCLRVRGKGYMRRTNLVKHRKREHPDAPNSKTHYSCRSPGCSGSGAHCWDLFDHYVKEHDYSRDFAKGLINWWLECAR